MPTESSIEHLKRAVIDASIAVKLFSEETGSQQAEVLLKRCFEGSLELSAPDLLIYEVANALGKGKKFQNDKIVQALGHLYDSGVEFFQPDKELTSSAAEIMTRYHLSFYDASYAALANILHAPLLSADVQGHKKIPEIEIIDLH